MMLGGFGVPIFSLGGVTVGCVIFGGLGISTGVLTGLVGVTTGVGITADVGVGMGVGVGTK